MAKSPKTETDGPKVEDETIEDAVILDEPEADLDEPVAAGVAAEELSEEGETAETDEPAVASTEATEEEPDTAEAPAEPWAAETDPAGEQPADEPVTDTPSQAAPARRSGAGAFVGFVIGGLIAGGVGFGAAQYVSGGWPFESGDVAPDPMAETVTKQAEQIAQLRSVVDANSEGLAKLEADTSVDELGGALRADIVQTQTLLTELSGRVDALDERITALEKMPGGDSAEAAQAAADAYERELAEMRAMLDREIAALQSQQEEAQTLQVNAAEAAQAAAARAAMARIMAALDSGQPFDDALFDLTTATGTDAPQGLAAVSSEGVPTLSELQDSFPEAARESLDLALRAMVEAGEIGRGEAFLRTQLGTRSLEPKEGDDPDAILSRAEFALKNGQIAEALEELTTMPDAAQPELEDWIAEAQIRQAALDAGASLAQDVNK